MVPALSVIFPGPRLRPDQAWPGPGQERPEVDAIFGSLKSLATAGRSLLSLRKALFFVPPNFFGGRSNLRKQRLLPEGRETSGGLTPCRKSCFQNALHLLVPPSEIVLIQHKIWTPRLYLRSPLFWLPSPGVSSPENLIISWRRAPVLEHVFPQSYPRISLEGA